MDTPDQHLIDELVRNLKANDSRNGHHKGHHADLPDERVIELCRKAKNAAKFASLFDDGDTSAHNHDDSSADLALVGIFAFYTQDPDQIDRLYRRSRLMRSKWERADYRARTINRAVSDLKETYSKHRAEPTGSGSGSPISNGTGTDQSKGRTRLASTAFCAMGPPVPRRYLVEGLIPESYPALFYGDGGVAKSLLALSLGLAVAGNAESWLGRTIPEGGKVLYVDFELDAAEQNRRVSRLARAEGLGTVPEGLRYMSALGVRARHAFEDALEECQTHGVKLLIADSLGPALEGDAEAARDVIAFHNEVVEPFRAAGIAVVLIDHQSKMQAGERYQSKRAFGSVYKSNLCRSVVQVEAMERAENALTVRLRQNKHNFGALAEPFGAKLQFTEEMIAVQPTDLEVADLAEEGTLNARDRIQLAIQTLGEGTRREINELVSDLAPGTMKKELAKLKDLGKTAATGDKREGQEVIRLIGSGSEPIRGTGTGTDGKSPPHNPPSDGDGVR